MVQLVKTTSYEYKMLIDDTTTSNVTYVCKAEVWRQTSEEFWQIFIVDETSWNTEIKRPVGSDWLPSSDFKFEADDRATYTYQ